MTPAAAAIKRIAEYGRPVRFDARRCSIVAIDVETRVVVTQFHLRRGADSHDVLPKIIAVLLDAGCEIAGVDGEDPDAPVTADAVDWSKL